MKHPAWGLGYVIGLIIRPVHRFNLWWRYTITRNVSQGYFRGKYGEDAE